MLFCIEGLADLLLNKLISDGLFKAFLEGHRWDETGFGNRGFKLGGGAEFLYAD